MAPSEALEAVTQPLTSSASDPHKKLQRFIRDHGLLRSTPEQPLRNEAGEPLSWMFDLRPLLLNSAMLELAAQLFWNRMSQFWPFQVAGLELAAIPLLVAITLEGQRRGKPTSALIVRKKRKKYARQNVVEGIPQGGIPMILIDDCINSARAVGKVLLAVQELGLSCRRAFTLIDFQSRASRRWASSNGVLIESLFTPRDFGLQLRAESAVQTQYEVLWTFASPRVDYRFAVAKSSPALYGDHLIFGSDSGIVWSLQKQSGRMAWWYDTQTKVSKGVISSPLIVHGRVYFGDYSGVLHCLDAKTGGVLWRRKLCDHIGSSPCHYNGSIFVGLEFANRAKKGALAKVSAQAGDLAWEHPTREMLHGSPVYAPAIDSVVIGTNDCTVLQLDPDFGTLRQMIEVGGPVKAAIAIKDDCAVFGSFDGAVYLWNLGTGAVATLARTEDIVYSRPLIVGDLAYIGSADGALLVLSLSEKTCVARIEVAEKVHSAPVLIGQTVYFGTSAGELIGIDALSLNITDRFQFPERLTNAVIGDAGILFVWAFDNKMWAVRPIATENHTEEKAL